MKAELTSKEVPPEAESVSASTVLVRLRSFLDLTKPRVTLLVVWTTAGGFYMAGEGPLDWTLMAHTVLGTLLVAAGTAALNQVIERTSDELMVRTADRPVPAGRLDPARAAVFGVNLLVAGSLYLLLFSHWLTAFLGCLTAAVYLGLYTPLKTRTTWCTFVGAFPGAVPPLMGWAAVRGGLDFQAFLLFAILFLWQFPHFLSIGWLYREDYERGGFRMLPILDREGKRTGLKILLYSLILFPVSLLPFATGMTGGLYLWGAVVLGAFFVWLSARAARRLSADSARWVLKASVTYLPLLLILMALDKNPG